MYVQNAVPKNNLKLGIKTEYTHISMAQGDATVYIFCIWPRIQTYTVTSASAA